MAAEDVLCIHQKITCQRFLSLKNPKLFFWFNNSTFQLLQIQFQFSVVTIPYLLVEKQPPAVGCFMSRVL